MTGDNIKSGVTCNQFYSDILKSCDVNQLLLRWVTSRFKHHEIVLTKSDKEYIKNNNPDFYGFDSGNNQELESLYEQRYKIDQKIKSILNQSEK